MSWQLRADVGDPESVPAAPGPIGAAAARLDPEAELLLANRMARLQRVVSEPGSNDRAFLREIRGRRPETLTEKQAGHVQRLCWKYRFQLPPALRALADPDKPETT